MTRNYNCGSMGLEAVTVIWRRIKKEDPRAVLSQEQFPTTGKADLHVKKSRLSRKKIEEIIYLPFFNELCRLRGNEREYAR